MSFSEELKTSTDHFLCRQNIGYTVPSATQNFSNKFVKSQRYKLQITSICKFKFAVSLFGSGSDPERCIAEQCS